MSLTTWFLFVVASLLLFIYGLHKRRPAIYVGNGARAGGEFADDEWHPDVSPLEFELNWYGASFASWAAGLP